MYFKFIHKCILCTQAIHNINMYIIMYVMNCLGTEDDINGNGNF